MMYQPLSQANENSPMAVGRDFPLLELSFNTFVKYAVCLKKKLFTTSRRF
jgi:hypothetical protein